MLVMIETRAGLEAVGEIAATDGLDGVYIGPSDLSLGLGAHPTPTIEHAVVLDAIATIRAAAEAAGVLCGLHCLSGEDAARFVPEGFPMVTAGADSGLLRAAVASALAAARGTP